MKRKLQGVGITIIGIGVFLFWHKISQPDIFREGGITELECTLGEFSFQENTGTRRNGKQYYIWVPEYPCTFQIPAWFSNAFDQSDFRYRIHKGDPVFLQIATDDKDEIMDDKEEVFLYGLKDRRGRTYLALEETKEISQSAAQYYIAAICLIGGIVMLYFARRRKKEDLVL